LRIMPACEAGLSAGMRRERVPPEIRKRRERERVGEREREEKKEERIATIRQ